MCQTYLVTGGFGDGYLSSTELLVETAAAWVFTGQLPTPRSGLTGANIDGRILMTGGYDGGFLEDILEFSPNTGDWSLLGQMMMPRYSSALSVISARDVRQVCN